MRILVIQGAFLVISCGASSAAFTDFSDYTAEKTSFQNGEIFQSGDLFFRQLIGRHTQLIRQQYSLFKDCNP